MKRQDAKFALTAHTHPKTWPGETLKDYVGEIQSLIDQIHREYLLDKNIPISILDYGCGKAKLHFEDERVRAWKADLYDPYVPAFSKVRDPLKLYDLIICTDVMEHVHPFHVCEQITEIINRLRHGGTAFFSVCCRPAHLELQIDNAILNAHFTVAPPDWWRMTFLQAKLQAKKEVEIVLRFSGQDYWTKEKLESLKNKFS